MKNLEIQSVTNLPDGIFYQNIYVLDNRGARIKKFVCRLYLGEKLEATINSAKQFISNNSLNPKYNEYQQRFAN